MYLNCLENVVGHSPGAFDISPLALRKAMILTIACLNSLAEEAEIVEPSMLNFAVTDGHAVICTRYISSKEEEAASLYFSSGTRFHEYKQGGSYRMERHDRGQDIVMIASEPLTFEKGSFIPHSN